MNKVRIYELVCKNFVEESPATTNFKTLFRIFNDSNTPESLVVYDGHGRIVYEKQKYFLSTKVIFLNVCDYVIGSYMPSIKANGKSHAKKFVIIK